MKSRTGTTVLLYIDRRSVREVSRLKMHVFSLVRFRFSRRFLGAMYRVVSAIAGSDANCLAAAAAGVG